MSLYLFVSFVSLSLCPFCPSFPTPQSLLLRAAREGLAVAGQDARVREDLLRPQLHGDDIGRLVGNLLLEFLWNRNGNISIASTSLLTDENAPPRASSRVF